MNDDPEYKRVDSNKEESAPKPEEEEEEEEEEGDVEVEVEVEERDVEVEVELELEEDVEVEVEADEVRGVVGARAVGKPPSRRILPTPANHCPDPTLTTPVGLLLLLPPRRRTA